MKALKILGIILSTLVLAIVVFWLGWMSPPAADDVCDNVAKVFQKETGETMPDNLKKECIAQYSREPEFGRLPWVKKLKCIRDADTGTEMEACEAG